MACAGGGPLLHPAHVNRPGVVTVGGGLAGQIALRPEPPASHPAGASAGLQDLTVAPGVSPWVSGRVGIADDNEAGLAYSGRSIRIDGRHAFELGPSTALSIGLGASAVVAQRPGQAPDGTSVYGGGVDLPILLGWRSASDLYSLWVGPRIGVELLNGRLSVGDPTNLVDMSAKHLAVGGVVGLRAGFRHVHVAIELDGAYHGATGTLGATKLTLSQGSLTPAGALLLTF